jgi:hypothetical protein
VAAVGDPAVTATSAATDGRWRRRLRNEQAAVDAILDLLGEGVVQPTAQDVADRSGGGPPALAPASAGVTCSTRSTQQPAGRPGIGCVERRTSRSRPPAGVTVLVLSALLPGPEPSDEISDDEEP